MTTPADERPEPSYGYNVDHPNPASHNAHHAPAPLPSYNINNISPHRRSYERSSEEEGTMVGEGEGLINRKEPTGIPQRSATLLTVETAQDREPFKPMVSPSQTREQARRLDDDLELLKIERKISRRDEKSNADGESLHQSRKARRDEDVDEFDIATNPVHEKTQVYKGPENPSSKFGLFFKKIHKSNWVVRYFTYIAPLALILLIPLLLGVFLFRDSKVGGVTMYWFMIWLEIVWLTLWAGRILAKCLPWPIGVVSSLWTNNSKKWRDMGKQLELPATLFFWWLAVEISFLPTMTQHMPDRTNPDGTLDKSPTYWQKNMNKVLVSILVGAVLNFVEKIIIQLIAISFHLRTYADRIELNKFQIGSLIKLYVYSKAKIAMEDSEFEAQDARMSGSGARTPGAILNEAAKTTKEVVGRVGDVAGKIAGDFTGKTVYKSTHPNQVVITLLSSVSGSQVLARRLYRTFGREETETVFQEDLQNAFENEEEATAAFSMFDKDMNGDISMEELEAVCVEIGRERKSITASLKDLDSVVGKLDDVFMFIVAVITILVFISLISTSAAGVLTSAGSAVLALSWLFSTTAQEFLQSVVFVFIKHPFDVGDRVGIYGNTGATGLGDDYFVKEISLLYTEFKKMEGHVVQAPNSYLNTLFILNQRRSGGLAEAVHISIKFGTTLEQIEGLRSKLLEFVKSEKREYQGNILTELRDIVDVHSMNLNVVFFYKSNWQNEGLRLARRNKFICAMMVCMQELGIEGPYMRFPGLKQSFPMYLQSVPHINNPAMGTGGQPDNPAGFDPNAPQDQPFVEPQDDVPGSRMRSGSILRNGSTARHGESLSAMNKRVDFSLGMKDYAYGDLGGDVHDDRQRHQMTAIHEASRSRERAAEAERRSNELARTTSRDTGSNASHGVFRRSTDSDASRTRHSMHRNRFFTRNRPSTSGPHDEAALMEKGMADIPENSSPQTSNDQSTDRLDPRTGLVSSSAWRTTTNESDRSSQPTREPMMPRIPTDVLPSSSRPLGATVEDEPEYFQQPGRSATQDFEMKKLH